MRTLIAVALLCIVATIATKDMDMPMPGAPVETTAGDEDMARVLTAVNTKLNDPASNNGPYHFVPVKILKSSSQVVAGSLRKYEVVVGESSCKKGDMLNTELTAANCQLREGANRAIYKISIWEKPWENFQQIDVEKLRDVAASEQF